MSWFESILILSLLVVYILFFVVIKRTRDKIEDIKNLILKKKEGIIQNNKNNSTVIEKFDTVKNSTPEYKLYPKPHETSSEKEISKQHDTKQEVNNKIEKVEIVKETTKVQEEKSVDTKVNESKVEETKVPEKVVKTRRTRKKKSKTE